MLPLTALCWPCLLGPVAGWFWSHAGRQGPSPGQAHKGSCLGHQGAVRGGVLCRSGKTLAAVNPAAAIPVKAVVAAQARQPHSAGITPGCTGKGLGHGLASLHGSCVARVLQRVCDVVCETTLLWGGVVKSYHTLLLTTALTADKPTVALLLSSCQTQIEAAFMDKTLGFGGCRPSDSCPARHPSAVTQSCIAEACRHCGRI
jgi:hypothetical protein